MAAGVFQTEAGALRARLAFDQRAQADDGAGNKEGDWSEQFACRGRITPLRGGEEVTAARLQGTSPVLLTVRSTALTRTVDSTWRARDVSSGVAYAIKSTSNMDERNIWIEMMCEAGIPS